jgi:uncharacterized membrane protein
LTVSFGATLYDWLLFAHILVAMVWVGGAFLLNVLAWQALRHPEDGRRDRFITNLRIIGPRVFAPAVMLLVGFGIWLVLDSDAWSFDQTWIQIGLACFAAAFLVGVGFLSVTSIRAERAVAQRNDLQATRQLRLWALGYQIVLIVLVVAVWDMVIKPGT